MGKNVIISVESRKGGVGKTTAALCIGKNLLEKDYAVLLIDTDITGTNIADCMDSPFWHNHLNILTITKNKKQINANLLNLFEETFMNGFKSPSFKNKKNGFNIDSKKINIIGSQIYSADGKPITICKPEILFDQLHGYWFIDFLKELIEDFAAAISNKPIAVIFDNSPGYVGIAPAIQEWLTDLGPETGKFLIVTSLDSQDMQSCATTISVLHEQYKDKWNTSRTLLEVKKKEKEDEEDDDIDYSLMKGDFFAKLIEYEVSSSDKTSKFPAPLAFYNISKESINEYSEHPERYLGVIVNRVPKIVFKRKRAYQPDLHRNSFPFLDLLGGQNSNKWGDYMVGYDPYIEHQFLQSGLSNRRYRRKWSRNLGKLLMQKELMFHEKEFLHMPDMVLPESFNQMNDHINQLQNIINTAMDAMRANGLDNLADLIEDDWQPKSIVARLQATFYNFMANADHPSFREIYWEEFEDERIIREKGLYRIDKIIHRLDIPVGRIKKYSEIRNTALYLIASLPLPISRKMPFDEEILDFFRKIMKFELSLIEKSKSNYRDLPRILSSDIRREKDKKNIKELLHKFEFIGRFFHDSEDEFFDFFHAFTSAQARLMRLTEDTRFLIWLIQAMVEFESEKPDIPLCVKQIAEDVIIHRTLSYDMVKEESSQALSKAQFFIDFDRAIKNIIGNWGIKL